MDADCFFDYNIFYISFWEKLFRRVGGVNYWFSILTHEGKIMSTIFSWSNVVLFYCVNLVIYGKLCPLKCIYGNFKPKLAGKFQKKYGLEVMMEDGGNDLKETSVKNYQKMPYAKFQPSRWKFSMVCCWCKFDTVKLSFSPPLWIIT